jgi:hypothetical protein
VTEFVLDPPKPFELTVAQTKAQQMLISDAVYCALGGGARSGKTFLLVRAILYRALKSAGSRHAIFRFRFNALKTSVILDTLPKVLKLEPDFDTLPPLSTMLNKTDWILTLPNGSEVWFGGLDDNERVEKILGQEFATIYFNECSQIPWHSVTTALTRLAQKTDSLVLKAYYDFNPPSKNHWTYLQFVEKKSPDNKQVLPDPFEYGFYLINPADNKENLDPRTLKILEGLPPRKRERFLLGRFADDSDGALWTVELLDQNRVTDVPEMLRIVIAVDPSGTKGDEETRSDEVGIVVVGLGTDSHGYVLEDLSGNWKPEQWADIVVNAYERHQADRVVAETNYGGDMVRAVIQAKDPLIPFTPVTATRGKVVRAEPISALYEQHKVHHVGRFAVLEDQLCEFTIAGYTGLKSPDRGDAVIWGLTELFPKMTRKVEEHVAPPVVHVPSRSASRYDARRRRR